jgi:ribosomal-protein-alanine N-acetyltransferase
VQSSSPYYELHKQEQYSPWTRKIFDDCLISPYFAFSIDQDSQPIGYYIAMRVLDEVTLMDIVVSPAYQGKGYGKLLLKHLMEYCYHNNIQQIWLEVRESNGAAINLYDKAGFILVEQRVNYYPSKTGKEDALIMCCYLG